MSLPRRSVILAASTVSLGAAGTAALAAATPEPTPNIITFTARRTKATLPNPPATVPALGTTFIAYLSLLDEAGKPLGDGSVNGSIVDVIPTIPPKLVVQVQVVFRLADGELHASNMHIRTIPNPGVRHVIAITGGTGSYRTARGSGSIEHVNETDTTVVLNVMVDPPA